MDRMLGFDPRRLRVRLLPGVQISINMDELKNNEIEFCVNIINWGIKNKYCVNFDADSDIVEYQHIEINFKTKEIKIS
jgi:hypothetical protein